MTNPLGHGVTVPTTNIQHDSLIFTVNPDRSVEISSNMTTYSSSLQNASKLFPPGYAIRSSSSFSQQANAVVETTNTQYQLPQALNYNLSRVVSSISFTASQTGLSGRGSLAITTTTLSPVQSINLAYSTSSVRISVNASAQVYFSSSLYAGTPFENRTFFERNWNSTFGNQTWINNERYQIHNATQILNVFAFYGNVTYSDDTSASLSITFVGVPSGSAPDFVTAFDNLLMLPSPLLNGMNNIIQSALNLSTGETATLTYTANTGTVNFQSTTNYVSNLDTQLNSLKSQFFQLIFNADPALENVPSLAFLNSTSVTVSKVSMTSYLDLNAGTYNTALAGLVIGPPTVGTNTNFTIPGLFQTLGTVPFSAPGINITLAGGSDSSNQVKIIVPGTPLPTSTTSNTATWTNVMNASELQNVRFLIQPLPFSFLVFLTSPTGFAIEAIIAAAIVAGIVLYARKRRTKAPPQFAPSSPTPVPGFGPSPVPPTQ